MSAAERRRRRQRLAWTALAAAGAALLLLLLWEAAAGTRAAARPAGYLAAAGLMLVAGVVLARRWRAKPLSAAAVGGRIERLFPQTRGALTDALTASGRGLAEARAAAGRAWVERRGAACLDAALGADDRRRTAGRRRLALGLIGLAAATALVEPVAARRMAAALRDPGGLWGGAAGRWSVSPGNSIVAAGESIAGRVRFVGPAAEGPLVLETRRGGGAWRAETLAVGPAGSWTWSGIESPRRYRLRFGPFSSPTYTIEVESPLALIRFEARVFGGDWAPLAGRAVPVGSALDLRGEATRPLAWAELRSGREKRRLAVRGGRFEGAPSLGPGRWKIAMRDLRGTELTASPFLVLAADRAFVEIVRPAEDPVTLAAEGAWLEVRGGAPGGLRELSWETADGRAGQLGAAPGARDTTIAAVVPLAAGRGPGDTVRYRAVARAVSGAPAVTPWRTAVVADRAALMADAADARAQAAAAVDRALGAAREAEEIEAPATDPEAQAAAQALDRQLQAVADSLAGAIERTLADPALAPALAERLEGYRRLLQEASGPLTPQAGMRYDPAAAASARASMLAAIQESLAEADRLLRLSMAADSLARLAAVQGSLAERTRSADPGALESEIAPRQAAVERSARQAAGSLPDSLAAGMEEALDQAGAAVAAGDIEPAAAAQESAAGALSRAAEGARDAVDQASEESAARRAAMDRAGAETLFLAERQRELAERMEKPSSGAAEHADRIARQRVVTRGLEATLGTLVEAVGGRPAGVELARRLAEAVFSTRYAEEAVASPPWRVGEGPAAAAAAADHLALLTRAFLLPADEGGGSGPGGQGRTGAVAGQLEAMAGAERALSDALAGGTEPSGGNAEAAAAQRGIGRQLEGQAGELAEMGIDSRSVAALRQAVEDVAARLERGLPGAEAETDLRALARRFADLGRILERSSTERRRSETARSFMPAEPPPLAGRVTATRLDPEAALAAWRSALPRAALGVAQEYLERLAAEGVRAPGGGP